MSRRCNGVVKTLICIGGEVDNDIRSRRNRSGYLDIEHYFTIGIPTRLVFAPVHRDSANLRF
jgi:hypothetical protein